MKRLKKEGKEEEEEEKEEDACYEECQNILNLFWIKSLRHWKELLCTQKLSLNNQYKLEKYISNINY